MFFPAFINALLFYFSRDLELREAGFCSQLSLILKSPFKKKFINYNRKGFSKSLYNLTLIKAKANYEL
jgi:hypothetical protein